MIASDDFFKRTPVIHKLCGGQVGWLLGPQIKRPLLRAENFERMDGSHPVVMERFREKCPDCRVLMNNPTELQIVSEEVTA